MKRSRSLFVTLLFSAASAASGASADAVVDLPRPASPGTERGATVPFAASVCPTFSWSTVAGARGYELSVWRLPGEAARVPVPGQPVLRERLEGAVGSWTPSPPGCLDPGESYGWSVAVVAEGGEPRWSGVALFRIAPPPSAADLERAIEVIERHLAATGPLPTPPASPASRRDEAAVARRGRGQRAGATTAGGVSGARGAGPEPRDSLGLTAAMMLDGDLHLEVPDNPRLRLEQDGSGGFGVPQAWDVVGNETFFAVSDATAGVAPFLIATGAPDGALTVDSGGVISGDGSGLTNVDAATVGCIGCVDTDELAFEAVNGARMVPNTVGANEFARVYGIQVECNGNCGDGTLLELCGESARPVWVSCGDHAAGGASFPCGAGNRMTCANVSIYSGSTLGQLCEDTAGWDAIVYCLPEGEDAPL